jgi:hypothetical protein
MFFGFQVEVMINPNLLLKAEVHICVSMPPRNKAGIEYSLCVALD